MMFCMSCDLTHFVATVLIHQRGGNGDMQSLGKQIYVIVLCVLKVRYAVVTLIIVYDYTMCCDFITSSWLYKFEWLIYKCDLWFCQK